jgi:glycosyltransferase involved in cell wall biosynthesis
MGDNGKSASICIATYNKADYLCATLQSIFAQHPPFDFEVIVVDDGGKDDTPLVCKAFPVNYIRIDRVPGFRNPAHARNVAMRAAKSPIIIQNSDETVHAMPNTIERLVNELQSGTFVIATVYDYCQSTGRIGPQYTPKFNGNGKDRPFFFLGSCWRKDIYAIGGYDEEFTGPGYDDDFHAECLVKGRGLTPIYSGILGLHQSHPRPAYDWRLSSEIYERKIAARLFCSSGGPWEGF